MYGSPCVLNQIILAKKNTTTLYIYEIFLSLAYLLGDCLHLSVMIQKLPKMMNLMLMQD